MKTTITEVTDVTDELLDQWATEVKGPVAFHMKEHLIPVEGEGGVIFPPTYADIGYNIDTLSDGTKVATIDSVGSQANRIEPIFKAAPEGAAPNLLAALVPQISIRIDEHQVVSILDVGHRLGDAIIRSSSLRDDAKAAFEIYKRTGDASALAKLSPMSLVFGVWDSRDTSVKLPRIVQSVVRAWNVDELKRSAQYSPPVNYAELDVFSEEDRTKAEGDSKSPLAKRGFVDVPAPSAPGGVITRGPVVRDVTLNLVAIRRLGNNDNGAKVQRYILGLSLLAATERTDGFLRQGCLLTPNPSVPAEWSKIERDGKRVQLRIAEELPRRYAARAAQAFGVGPNRTEQFSKDLAKADLADGGKRKNMGSKPAKK